MPPTVPAKKLRELVHPIGPRPFILEEEYPVHYRFKGRWRRFLIPEGFIYDAASIPRVFWVFVSPLDLGFLPTGAHDYVIQQKGLVEVEQWSDYFQRWVKITTPPFTRKEADLVFRQLMKEEPIGPWKVWLAYRGVRSGGVGKRRIAGREW